MCLFLECLYGYTLHQNPEPIKRFYVFKKIIELKISIISKLHNRNYFPILSEKNWETIEMIIRITIH